MKTSTKILLASATTLILTVIHHAHGAVIYEGRKLSTACGYITSSDMMTG